MSTWAPAWREKPRWSVVSAEASAGLHELLKTQSSPASMAGLPGSRARVCVGPPLFSSGPSCGSMVDRMFRWCRR